MLLLIVCVNSKTVFHNEYQLLPLLRDTANGSFEKMSSWENKIPLRISTLFLMQGYPKMFS
jgi:hypothetical protein